MYLAIYTGLIAVERKGIDLNRARASASGPVPMIKDEGLVMILLHSDLLQQYHDFALETQHPNVPLQIRKLAQEYGMPSRVWYHGIHSLFEALDRQGPDWSSLQLEHMAIFLRYARGLVNDLRDNLPNMVDRD